jgi:cytochrome c5
VPQVQSRELLNKTKGKREKANIVFKLKIAVVFLFVIFVFLACSEGKNYKREFVIADSKSYEAALFRQNCAICHGQEATGKEVDGKLVPSLRYGEAAKKSEEEIYQQIAHGKLPMPSFRNQLNDDEIKKMVKFIMRDLQGR